MMHSPAARSHTCLYAQPGCLIPQPGCLIPQKGHPQVPRLAAALVTAVTMVLSRTATWALAVSQDRA
jgi:hypothetical protein